ncbi:intracellular protein transport protein USO1 isoform X2 [Drosophila serrata]|uniref:intracellular protein transport protein USO1 isoform X2 n=1 Tax=Drosophila serrata TaxID=7274 RepID=UPI000A1D0EAC|nr:intracellular protein transport protein USO1 isoform X2 [Drosophila serrata]
MAENQTKTTSGKGCNESRSSHVLAPHNGTVARRVDPGSRPKDSFRAERASSKHDIEDWQTMAKNKLKRKKKLSASLTSVGDTVNQEKRTRIEGIQLQCRGKLRPKDTQSFEAAKAVAPAAGSAKPAGKVDKEQRERERPVIIGGVTTTTVMAAPPQRIKRKLQENLDTIQKLNALTEQLRLEVNELKSSLITERGAVRALRAQNDADSRRWKSEVKKLQHTLDIAKKSNGVKKPIESGPESAGTLVTADGLINYEIQRLTNEIAVLKEANRTKEEKTQLEEIKTKERNIGQLRKDLLALQSPKKQQRQQNEAKVPQATTKPKTNTNETSQKPKKKPTTNPAKPTGETKAENEPDTDIKDIQNPIRQAQVTPEITQLKNIELINNSKNAHKSALEMRTTTTATTTSVKSSQGSNLDDEMRATTWMTTLHSSHPALKPKDHNSDTDSALSSAPPSISPQPPSSGSDSGVIWQTLQDMDKLQKEAEMYQKENERLHKEVQLMKQELESAEQAALSSGRKQTQIGELVQRIKELEGQRSSIEDESSELREQNELLEFRILELEDDSDKMESTCEGHCQRLQDLLEQSSAQDLEDRDKRCLQQLLQCVQQLDLDAMMPGDQNAHARRPNNQAQSHSHNSQNRIVATVQPYSNCATPSSPPTPSKRHCSQVSSWQSSSLSESGVFVECDLAPLTPTHSQGHPHLQYYQERLEQLEGKLLIYESSGDTQTRHLAQRLQKELQLEKDLKELLDRVQQLTDQNAQLEEAKCEFEEAENDTRLHLQRNEVELEILRQRNVELEFGKEALGAKYKDCRAEVIILREDLAAAETQLEHLQSERKQARKELQDLRQSLPLLLIWRLLSLAKMGNEISTPIHTPRLESGYHAQAAEEPQVGDKLHPTEFGLSQAGFHHAHHDDGREVTYLKEEIKSLRCQLKELNARHYEAMESADSHWVDLEQQYKEREDACQSKEASLKQKISQLQDCLREDSRAAAEKIQQLEEAEQGLKSCLVRLTKEHRDILTENVTLKSSLESLVAKIESEAEHKMPLTEALEIERRRNQSLMVDLSFAKKVQQNTEDQLRQETDALRSQIFDIKKEYLHIEVTNSELKEEVGTLENKIRQMESQMKDSEERARCLEDELRTKDEQCQILERKLGVIPENYSLADELYDSPAKRAKKDEVPDLQAASQGLGIALLDIERRERELPTHKDFLAVACSVKQLADTLLSQSPSEVSLVGRKPVKSAGSDSKTSWASVHDEDSKEAGVADEQSQEGQVSTGGDVGQVEPESGVCEASPETEDFKTIPETDVSPTNPGSEVSQTNPDSEVYETIPEIEASQPNPESQVSQPELENEGTQGIAECEESDTMFSLTATSQSVIQKLSSRSRRLRVARLRRSLGSSNSRISLGTTKQTENVSREITEGEPSQTQESQAGEVVLHTSSSRTICLKPCSGEIDESSSHTILQDLETARQPDENINENVEEPLPMMKKRAKVQQEDPKKEQEITLPRRRSLFRRFIYKRIYRGRLRLASARRRSAFPLEMSSSCNSFHSAASLHTLHSSRSRVSMHSQYANMFNMEWERVSTVSFVQTDVVLTLEVGIQNSLDCCEQEAQVQVETTECGSQIEESVEQRLLLMPLRTRCFVNLVQNAVDTGFDPAAFRARLIQMWESDEEFRENIERMQDMWTGREPTGWVESYEGFVAVLGCVRSLKLAVEPSSSALLEEIEQRINARVVQFYSRKIDSELCCTVYYPVERQNSVFFNVSK